MSIKKELFGTAKSGQEVFGYVLENQNGMRVRILEFAGAIAECAVPDKNGRLVDVVEGFDTLSSYERDDSGQGALIGRFANRIKEGKFTLDGVEYTLPQNNGNNHLHGGPLGFGRRLWRVAPYQSGGNTLCLTLTSPDGEAGYPGTLEVAVRYTLSEQNELTVEYTATTDKKTVVNLTNHAYFNLSGVGSGSVLGHELWLDAPAYLPTDEGLIPTGEIKSVQGTPFDFRVKKPIGRDIYAGDKDLSLAGGYDHCLCLSGGESSSPRHVATLSSPDTGIEMRVLTTAPCLQLYTANFLKNRELPLKGGRAQCAQSAVCLETEKMPDSPNKSHFTNAVLAPGELYRHVTVFAFG